MNYRNNNLIKDVFIKVEKNREENNYNKVDKIKLIIKNISNKEEDEVYNY